MDQSSSLIKLAQRILEEAEKVAGSNIDEESTRALFEATRELQISVLTVPRLLEDHQIHYQSLSCLGWLVRFNIFNYVPTNPGSIAYTDLAAKAGVPITQLQSVARMVMTDGLFSEPSPTHIAHTRLSASLEADSSLQDWISWITNYGMAMASRFAEATARSPGTVAKSKTAFNVALNTDLSLWDYMKTNPEMEKVFSGYMRGTSQSEGGRLQYLVDSFDSASLGEATIVDVGGSTAHASLALASAFPSLQFIVQDLPRVVEEGRAVLARLTNGPVTSRIRFVAHDFFTPQQPQDRGSAPDIYLLRRILHDWHAEQAHEILQHLAIALQNGGNPRARLIITDVILPQPGTLNRVQEAAIRYRDLTMGQTFNNKERELNEWEQLFASTNPPLHLKSWKQPAGSYLATMEVGLGG
jgi:6-hydroxytryprostatin B O-methyltransferase